MRESPPRHGPARRRPRRFPTTLATPSGEWTPRARAGPAAGVLVCGMGGSAIGGDLAAAALARSRLTGPLLTVRGYELPELGDRAKGTVLCSSYSGNTEETLALLRGRRRPGSPADRAGAPSGAAPSRAVPGQRRPSRSSGCPESCSRGPRLPTCSSPPRPARRLAGAARGLPPRSRRPPAFQERAGEVEGARRRARRPARGHRCRSSTAPALTASGRAAGRRSSTRTRSCQAFFSELPGGRPQRDLRLGRYSAREAGACAA